MTYIVTEKGQILDIDIHSKEIVKYNFKIIWLKLALVDYFNQVSFQNIYMFIMNMTKKSIFNLNLSSIISCFKSGLNLV